MRNYPAGGFIGKSIRFARWVLSLGIRVHAAGAGFFIALSVFPGLLLLLGLLRFTPLEVERLGELLASLLPEALAPAAEELVLLTYDASSGTAIGISALTTLWSASRGVYGLIGGLNAVYGVKETRSYFHRRWISVVYTLGFLLVLLLALGMHMFGQLLLGIHAPKLLPLLLFAVQILLLTEAFRGLPDRVGRFRDGLPGALFGALGWLVFTDLYSVYIRRYARLTNVYGSVYGVALSMLWLYCCVSILFYGALLNRLLAGKTVNNL